MDRSSRASAPLDHRLSKPGESTTALEAQQRAPTLMAGLIPGGGGAVQVWAPSRWRLLTGAVTSGFGGLALLAITYGFLFWIQTWDVRAADAGIFDGVMRYIRALLRPCYITTDDTGIGITTPEGSRSFRWADVERCQIPAYGSPGGVTLTFYVPDAVRADLTGYSYVEANRLAKIIQEKANLVRDPGEKRGVGYIRAPLISSFAPGLPAVPNARAPTMGGIGLRFERNSDGRLVIAAIEDHSPAADAGLMLGDELVSINHWAAEGLDEVNAASQSRAPEGSAIHLRVIRELWVKELDFDVRTASPY